MAVARLAQYGFKAVTGIGRNLAKKQVTKASAKLQGPLVEGIADEMCKNGKQYAKFANETSKWFAKEGQKMCLPAYMCQGGKVVQKGKFTPKGKQMLAETLQKSGLPKDATVQDLLLKSQCYVPGGKFSVVY